MLGYKFADEKLLDEEEIL